MIKPKDLYFVIFIDELSLTDDLSNCLMVACNNKYVLSEITDISVDQLSYAFVRKKLNVLHKKGCLIFYTPSFFHGRQKGSGKGNKLSGYNRNK
jgi:hypothetical protein